MWGRVPGVRAQPNTRTGGQIPGLVRGLEPTWFNTALSQSDPIATGCDAVILRVLTI